MGLINLSKWRSPIFIGKALWMAMVLSMWTLFSCAYTSAKINKLNLECQTGNKHACAKLTAIARNDKSGLVRIDAADKLTDKTIAQNVYADLLKNGSKDCDGYVREVAGKRLQALKKNKH